MTTNHVATETMLPESHLEPRRYRVHFACTACGHEFTRVYKAPPAKDPPCPRAECRVSAERDAMQREIANLHAMIASGRAPAHIGANTQVKAVDETAKIVMEDYGMTNLQDGVREGDTVAQKLPPVQQAAADNYFGASKSGKVVMPDFGTGGMRQVASRQMELIGRRAMAGAFRHNAVGPTSVVPNAAAGQSPLTHVGNRANDLYTGKR